MTNDQLPQCPKCSRLPRFVASHYMFPRGGGQHIRFARTSTTYIVVIIVVVVVVVAVAVVAVAVVVLLLLVVLLLWDHTHGVGR